jgi:hypothetical protein
MEAPRELELIGDEYYDKETGEFVGLKVDDGFKVKDQGSMEWVLEKKLSYETNLRAEEARIDAILANYEKMRKKAESKLRWFEARFLPEVEEYAKTQLTGKSKFIECPYGRVSFRTKKGGVRITDKEKALSYAKIEGWTNAINVEETLLIRSLTPAQKAVIEARTPQGFTIEPDVELCYVNTGVEK